MSLLNDLLYSIVSCLTCNQSPTLKINQHRFQIKKLLGEGGFSYVYLIEADDGQLYALKKVRCPFGPESLQTAMREIENYKVFKKSRAVIDLFEHSIVQEKDGKTVYMVFPFFRKGNLQDLISDNLINCQNMREEDIIDLFVRICRALRTMHKHMVTGPTEGDRTATSSEMDEAAMGLLDNAAGGGGGAETGGDTMLGEVVPYAHRDIKPANIMLNDTDEPILMDLGSTSRARVSITTRQEALELQDLAAEHCTLPYRAPELFDVKTGSHIDERVDIWSLGCTLFALMYLSSPFEMQSAESGASLNMAIMNGQYTFPASPDYSEGLKSLVRDCLTVDPSKRPFIDDILTKAEQLQAEDEFTI
ncbi:serine/threonine-protein kinase Env7p [Trichomonascus vanleenenianus]|uniref:putative serine/threonine protein kinase ENV7 n=1 Tax=Trichomonascus vanleenenianus TaxID=2268995 RepID=UPI003ECAC8EA